MGRITQLCLSALVLLLLVSDTCESAPAQCFVRKFNRMPVIDPIETNCMIRIPMNQCVGACKSIDKFPGSKTSTFCRCCEPVKFEKKKIEGDFLCRGINRNNYYKRKTMEIYEPVKCVCKVCGEKPKWNNDVH